MRGNVSLAAKGILLLQAFAQLAAFQRATGSDIVAARAAREVSGKPQRPAVRDESTLESIVDSLSPLPLWRQCIVVCGALISLGGVIWLKATFSFVEAGWSIAVTAAGVVLVGVGYAGLKPSASGNDKAGGGRDG